jgi:hypothetical protein
MYKKKKISIKNRGVRGNDAVSRDKKLLDYYNKLSALTIKRQKPATNEGENRRRLAACKGSTSQNP